MMTTLKNTLLLFSFSVWLVSCVKDEGAPPIDNTPDACRLIGVNTKIDETTSFGVFDVDYDANGRISEAGLQTYEFTYDGSGRLTEATLPGSNLNPQVRFLFSYSGDLILEIKENWGEEPNVEERYVFTPVYGGDGFVDKLMRTGLGGDTELDYDFDANGNVLRWSDPTFQDYREFTFGADKGLFENLDHHLAFAYGIAIGQPFFHFNNTVLSGTDFTSDGQESSSHTFSELEFNVLDFQTLAGDPNGRTYQFEYYCF
ncbi:MAG: hypothetical protein KDC34_10670 [Saprospiraceae bacterium]|nr:hypothetical protein [Saprospiraceae bacterium]